CVLVVPCTAGGPGPEQEPEPAYMGRTLRQWIADLKDAEREVRQQAAYTLSRMSPKIRMAFPALKAAVKESDPSVGLGAIRNTKGIQTAAGFYRHSRPAKLA